MSLAISTVNDTHRNPIRQDLNYNESAALTDAHVKSYKFCKTQQIIAYDTTDDDCNGVDLITIFNFVMDAGCIDSIACINSDADYSETSSRS